MSIWTDQRGRIHVGAMARGQRLHRVLPAGATAGDAKLAEAELRTQLAKASAPKATAQLDPPLTAIMGLYVQHAQATLRSADTAAHHAQRIAPWAANYTASQAQQCAEHIARDMRGHYAQATINRSLGTLKRGLTLAWQRGIIATNFGAIIQRAPEHNARDTYLTIAQVQAIAQHCTPPVQAAIWAALLTGARRGEVCQIEAQHIHTNHITIPRGHTKTLQAKSVPIVAALRPWLAHIPLQVTPEGIKSAWQRARTKAGLPQARYHDLRHSCASILIASGVDLYTVGEILGHSQVQTTKRYAHLQLERKATALDKLSALVQAHPKAA